MYGSAVEKNIAKMREMEIIGQVEEGLLRSRRSFKLVRAWDLLNLSTKLRQGPSMEERYGGSGN